MAHNPLFHNKNELFRGLLSTIPRKAMPFPQRHPHFSAAASFSHGKDVSFSAGPTEKNIKKWMNS